MLLFSLSASSQKAHNTEIMGYDHARLVGLLNQPRSDAGDCQNFAGLQQYSYLIFALSMPVFSVSSRSGSYKATPPSPTLYYLVPRCSGRV
jgi:hypothetical protein